MSTAGSSAAQGGIFRAKAAARRLARRAAAPARLLDRLLPAPCVTCGRTVEAGAAPVCRPCMAGLPDLPPPWCERCGATSHAFTGGVRACAECVRWPEGLRTAAAYRMDDAAARLVRALKYAGWTALGDRMGRAMGPPARRMAAGRSPLLAPVPLSPARRRERGFNQSRLLASGLAATTGWEVRSLLARRGSAQRQARLGRAGREQAVRAAFVADEAPPRPRPAGPRGRPVLIVDDVVTTGSTADACRRALRATGWRPLGAVAFARSVGEADHGAA